MEKEISELKSEIQNSEMLITSLANENSELSSKKMKFLQEFSYLNLEIENKTKLLNEKMQSELDSTEMIDKKYDIVKHKILDKPYVLNEDLLNGPNKEEAEIFNCPICLNIVNQPETCTDCETIFCSLCLSNHLKFQIDCPNCKVKPISKGKMGRMLKNQLDNKQFDCPLSCGVKFKYIDSEKHQQICSNIKDVSKCNLCDEIVGGNNNLKENHLKECEKLKMKCFYCEQELSKSEYRQHLDDCDKALLHCLEGKIKIPRKFDQIHLNFLSKEVQNYFNIFFLLIEKL